MPIYWSLHNRVKSFYFSLKAIACAALGGRKIVFDQRGFRHILIKGRRKRPIPDQIRRMKKLLEIKDTLGQNDLICEPRNKGSSEYIKLVTPQKPITKVILLEKSGILYFISIQ